MAREIPRAAGGILSYFTRHRTLANLLLVLMLAAGVLAAPNMRAQFFPDVIIDNVTVGVTWEGAGPEDVDTGIVQVLEPALLSVEGVESSQSTSTEGRASITLEFEPNWDMGRAADDVQTAVDAINTLPEEAEDPSVRRGAWRDRVTDVVITGPVSPQQLGLFADELVTRLFAQGVTRTTIQGVAAPQVLVEVPSARLIAYDVSMAEIAAAIASEVDANPAGDVTGANARVRTGTEKRSAQEISGIVLRSNPDGSKLTVGDIARVEQRGIDRSRTYFVGPDPAVSVRVDRTDRGDAIAIQHRVEEVAEALQATLPPAVTVELIRTRAEAISGRLDLLIDNGLVGLMLVVALLFLFLNARTAIWVAAGIPVAMMAAIALMYVGGLTINMISLFGLIITLGIVVDDAIVVGEHADHRARHYGESPVVAAETAAQRMAMPVFAATLTTVIAFFGLVVVGGRFGDLIRDIPYTVIVVLIASLIECFLILPHHMSHAIRPDGQSQFSLGKLAVGLVTGAVFIGGGAILVWALITKPEDGLWAAILWEGLRVAAYTLAACALVFLLLPRRAKAVVVQRIGTAGIDLPSKIVNRGFEWLRDKLFRPFMAGVIVARYVVLAGVLAILASQISLFIAGEVQWRFFNSPERGTVTGNFAMAEGATRADTIEMMREMQRATEALGKSYEERFGRNPLDYVIAEIGGNGGRGLAGADTKDPDQLGGISIELIDADLRPYSSFAFVAELQEAVVAHPLAETVSFRGSRSGPGGDALDVQFFGASTDVLKAASEDLKRAMLQYPEVSAVEDNLTYDKEELILDLTAQGQALGFTIDMLGRALRNRLNGIEAATFPDGPRSATIRVELPENELTADFLERTQLRTTAGTYVPLADIVSVTRRTGFSTVRRENGIRLISVTGDISEDDPARAAEINRALETDILPRIASERQVEFRLSGLSEQEDSFLSDALLGLILCLTGIYLVLSWVFASWTRPIVVMAVIPFGLVGAIYGHVLWGVPLSMFTVVGLLGMTGIIINDSIVLVTTIDEYAAERGLIPSIIDGAADRLRPVMLTTLTTVLGMAPLLYEQSQDAQFLKPTVITLVYGLGFGMVLVLLVVPALLAAQHDVARQVRAMRRGMRARGLQLVLVPLWLAVLAWGAATLGYVLVTGALWTALTPLWPAVAALSPWSAALVLFAVGLLGAVALVYVLAALGYQLVRMRRTA
ncbi:MULTISPECIES: efflux RND transporter permease subunit [Roseobacteraceae]|uniref:Multidrug resistance protein MdtC n=1 Tax=Pseudosulfitobacter pseudonitzschiae TaxID=1402135 RepID=A0A221K328_9RHOB|nr:MULTISPECIES: efflux RND transporter permease subunit [Roseobacteraceae]ASM73273.1 multidrug resistance protein MdtC [Pseudosulfitobacter pseudonitzschiae]